MTRHRGTLLLILLLAAGLRLYALTAIPPGLTHDEANHGREALGVLNGIFLYFFPFNYGSEPLYSYLVAGIMGLIGRHLLALRLVNALVGVLTVALTYAWGRRAFGRSVGLTAALFMAVTFWPIAASREALRAGLLPGLTIGATLCFWQLWQWARRSTGRSFRSFQPFWLGLGFALALTAALHNYLAARVWWATFPAFMTYILLRRQPGWRRFWPTALGSLLLGGLLVLPMFRYLAAHPEMQPRLQMLDGTLQALRSGQLRSFIESGFEALLALGVPGYGDQFLAYNLPGRPVFSPLLALFLLGGALLALWRWRRPAYALLLLWLGTGLLPSLITGATANTTRNAAAMPALYLTLAVGIVGAGSWLGQKRPDWRRWLPLGLALLAVFAGISSSRDYFQRWANDPDVRAAYQVTIIAALKELDPAESALISSVYPGPAHDISIAMVTLGRTDLDLRWVDARFALIVPAATTQTAIIAGATPPHPAWLPWLLPIATYQLRPTDLDTTFTRYALTAPPPVNTPINANFNDALILIDAYWLAPSSSPGGVAELMTRWRVVDPDRIGPLVLPGFTTDVNLFTHVLGPGGELLTQRDALDAPSWSWHAGDTVFQIHQLAIPPNTAPGQYDAIVGVYDRASGIRLNRLGTTETTAPVPALVVATP